MVTSIFSFFLQCFQKLCFSRLSNLRNVGQKVNYFYFKKIVTRKIKQDNQIKSVFNVLCILLLSFHVVFPCLLTLAFFLSILLSSIIPSIHPSFCLSIHLSIRLSVSPTICLSVSKIGYFSYNPFVLCLFRST